MYQPNPVSSIRMTQGSPVTNEQMELGGGTVATKSYPQHGTVYCRTQAAFCSESQARSIAALPHQHRDMAAPTAAADTTAPPPPPPAEPATAAVPDQKVSHPPPLPPQPDAPPAPKKRKLEDAGFHTSDYYKIRAVVADLRVRFIQIHEATDFRNSDAAREILKEIKKVMELSKKMRLKLGATSEPVKPSEKPSAGPVKYEPVKQLEKPSAGPVKDEPVKSTENPSSGPVKESVKPSENPSAGPGKESVKPSENPSAGPVKDEPAGPIPSEENNQAPQVGQTPLPPNNASDAPIKHDNSESTSVKTKE